MILSEWMQPPRECPEAIRKRTKSGNSHIKQIGACREGLKERDDITYAQDDCEECTRECQGKGSG